MNRSILASASQLLMLGGIIVGALGYYLNIVALFAGGVALLGGGVVVDGLGAIIEGQWQSVRRRRVRASYSGLQARLIGIYLGFLGLVFIGVAFLILRGGTFTPSSQLFDQFVRRAEGISVILIVIGGVLSLWGLVNLLGSDEQNRSGSSMALSVPMRLLGIAMLLIGFALVVYGATRLTAPNLAEAWLRQAAQLVGLDLPQ